MQLELEKSILAILCTYPGKIYDIADRIEPTDFRNPNTRFVWESSLRLCQNGVKVDPVSLSQDLHENGKLEMVGGTSFINSLFEHVPSSENLDHFVTKLLKISKQHNLRTILSYGLQTMTKSGLDVDELTDNIGNQMMDLSVERQPSSGLIQDFIGSHRERFMAQNELFLQGKKTLPGIESGLPQLDTIIDCFRYGTLNVLGARPGIGKTAVGINIALNVAKEGHPVIFFSMEMTKEDIMSRMLAILSGINSRLITSGNLYEVKVPQLESAYQELGALPIVIDDRTNTIEGIRSICRKWDFKFKGIGLMIFDYLQLIRVKGKNTEYEQVTEASRSLKEISKRHNCPILAIAQLNRAVLTSKSKKGKQYIPSMENLRSSGQIEQDADTIVFLTKKDRDEPNLSTLEFDVKKNRHGQIGKFEMDFKWDTCTLTKSTILDTNEDDSDM